MSTAKKVLSEVKRRRELDAAVELLRKRTQRNVPLGIVYGVFGAACVWEGCRRGVTLKIDGKSALSVDGIVWLGQAGIWITVALQRMWIRSADLLLLTLAEEALARARQSNQALVMPALAPPAAGAARAPSTGVTHL